MMRSPLEILRLSPRNDLYQVSDGVRFGLVEVLGHQPATDPLPMFFTTEVQFALQQWLDEKGQLTGSQHPPRLGWGELQGRASTRPGMV